MMALQFLSGLRESQFKGLREHRKNERAEQQTKHNHIRFDLRSAREPLEKLASLSEDLMQKEPFYLQQLLTAVLADANAWYARHHQGKHTYCVHINATVHSRPEDHHPYHCDSDDMTARLLLRSPQSLTQFDHRAGVAVCV